MSNYTKNTPIFTENEFIGVLKRAKNKTNPAFFIAEEMGKIVRKKIKSYE